MEGTKSKDAAMLSKKGRSRPKMPSSGDFGEESGSSGKQLGV